ncbi:MAG TPA: hypothetical protein VFQ34_11350 [Nitrospiraceae bacterium]|jgi:hypothetical protein|nr:hypothetical protein [Nitrospiraceae bacterium]
MAPSDLPDPGMRPAPKSHRDADEDERHAERQSNVIGMMVGTALMFIGFLNVFLSISSGFEINVVPFLIYFGGLAIWANSVVENLTIRYAVIGTAIVLGLLMGHFGEVLFWHKQLLFWSTVIVVMYFMFTDPKKPA